MSIGYKKEGFDTHITISSGGSAAFGIVPIYVNLSTGFGSLTVNKQNPVYLTRMEVFLGDLAVNSGRSLSFYIKDKNICIEVQGEQHYFPIIFGNYSYEKAFDNFIKQQERDKIKKKYCEDNGIKLILLDYKCIRDNTFKDILLKNF